jgi:hypothetical protein
MPNADAARSGASRAAGPAAINARATSVRAIVT